MLPNPILPEGIAEIHKQLQLAELDPESLYGLSGNGSTQELELTLVRLAGGQYAIALSNGTAALITSFFAAGIQAGDEVIFPEYSWPQTLFPLTLTGGIPRFAKTIPNSFSIDPAQVEKLLSKRTRAIVAVHLFGIPTDVRPIVDISRRQGVRLIVDAAQGFGSSISGRPLGEYGDFVAFSFGPSKIVSAGESGALCVGSRMDYERCIAISQHPLRIMRQVTDWRIRTNHYGMAFNFRLHPLVASLLVGQINGFFSNKIDAKFRRDFREAWQKTKACGLTQALPDLSSDCEPSGVALPLFISSNDQASRFEHLRKSLGEMRTRLVRVTTSGALYAGCGLYCLPSLWKVVQSFRRRQSRRTVNGL